MSKQQPTNFQITIVDEAIRTNLPPAIDRVFNTKKIVLIHSSDFLQRAIDLSKAYKHFQIDSIFEEISSSLSIETMEREIEAILNKYLSSSPLVNVSNGTKLNTIALYNVAKRFDLMTFCVNSNDTISWLSPESKAFLEIEDRIKIPTFLEANGFQYLGEFKPTNNQALHTLLSWMVENISDLRQAISQLNFYAYSAGKLGISKPLQGNVKSLEALLSKFQVAGLVELKNNRIYFLDEDVRFFANGGWLEEFIHYQIQQIKSEIPELHDFRAGVEVISKENRVKNEIDNLALVNNQLYLIECKTKKYSERGHPEGGAMDALYKMDTLMAELGGPVAKGMIVSVYPFSEAEINRAKQYDIELVAYDQIQNVKQVLQNWFVT